MVSGEIYRHDRFYRDADSGELKRKFLVLLARTPGGDWVARLLTSQANLRSERPPCSLSPPYPGYYLGVIGGQLPLPTWVDLRWLPDLDPVDVDRMSTLGIMSKIAAPAKGDLQQVLECAARADDTTRQQELALRDQLAKLGSE